MRELTADEKIFLEELLVNVKEVEILVWDDTKTDTVKSMILQIGRKAKEKRDVSEFHEREQIKIARHAKARGDTPSPKSQPSLFLTSMYGAVKGELISRIRRFRSERRFTSCERREARRALSS